MNGAIASMAWRPCSASRRRPLKRRERFRHEEEPSSFASASIDSSGDSSGIRSKCLRGLKTVVSQLEGETAVVGRQYAVLIAIDKYKNWMALRNPVKGAREIEDILSKRYFITDFRELYDEDAIKAGIIRLFNKCPGSHRIPS